MKCQNLFSGKNKKNINLLSPELAQRMLKVIRTVEMFSVKTESFPICEQLRPDQPAQMPKYNIEALLNTVFDLITALCA